MPRLAAPILRSLGLLALAALTACGSGGGASPRAASRQPDGNPSAPPPARGPDSTRQPVNGPPPPAPAGPVSDPPPHPAPVGPPAPARPDPATAVQNRALLKSMREHYLFQDLLPAQVDPDAFATTKALFAALTKPARDLGRDRWSVLIGPEDWAPGAPPVTPPSFTDTRDRFGLLVAARGQQVFVSEALPGSPPGRAGLRRTGGKPVVISVLLPNPGETFSLILALSRHLNRDGLTDWFGGLPCPGFPGLSCAVAEDFSHPRGDPEEACTKAALTWLRTGHLPGGPFP